MEAYGERKHCADGVAVSAQHTPGPWRVEPLTGFRKFVILGPDKHAWNGCRKSVAYTGASYSLNREANAHLIAAAPELLKALETLLDASERHIFGDECLAERDAARAVIAKAKGDA